MCTSSFLKIIYELHVGKVCYGVDSGILEVKIYPKLHFLTKNHNFEHGIRAQCADRTLSADLAQTTLLDQDMVVSLKLWWQNLP